MFPVLLSLDLTYLQLQRFPPGLGWICDVSQHVSAHQHPVVKTERPNVMKKWKHYRALQLKKKKGGGCRKGEGVAKAH